MNESVQAGRIDPVPEPEQSSASPRGAGARRGLRARWRARSSRDDRGLWALVTTLFVVGAVAASTVGARSEARADADKQRLAFHLSSEEVASTLKLALQREEDLLLSASAQIEGSPGLSPAGFAHWAESVHAMQRYPELQNIGLVAIVRASELPTFQARVDRLPARPRERLSLGAKEPFQLFPAGRRPYYCLGMAGVARTPASYLPVGVDYCALAKSLISARDTGTSRYAPFVARKTTMLGVETPVYRDGRAPATVAARRHAFIGWLGELLTPELVLQRALEGHPDTAATFRYRSGGMDVAFRSGTIAPGGQSATVDLHNGWTVRTFGAGVSSGLLGDGRAAELLLGGSLLGVLFGLLVYVLATSRTRALSLVREKTRELSHQALHDALTGLPNRTLVLDRAEQILARAVRQPGVVAGALFIDLDGFKHVNDNLGHAAGDRLLRVVGERLQGAVREQDTVGRLGGDEFVVLVESESARPSLDSLAARLIEELRRPVSLEQAGGLLSFTASIGVAMGHYRTPDELLREADIALYSAKGAGRDRYAVYDASMEPAAEPGHRARAARPEPGGEAPPAPAPAW
jgi:diguanylate cyclase (GGDEF)-like protein